MSVPEPIVQTGVGFERRTLLRLDRLRAVHGRSRSHVLERIVSTALEAEEAQHADALARFAALADGAGMSLDEYTSRYVRTFGAKTFPPTVAQLEEIKFCQRDDTPAPKRKEAGKRAAEATRTAGAVTADPRIADVPLIRTLSEIKRQQEIDDAERRRAAGL